MLPNDNNLIVFKTPRYSHASTLPSSLFTSAFFGNLFFNDYQISEIFRFHSPVILISIEINRILLHKYRQKIRGIRVGTNVEEWNGANFSAKLESRFKASGWMRN